MTGSQKSDPEDYYATLPVRETEVFIAGSGPIGATFCRKILEEHPSARVYMADIGSQDNPVIGAHHKNSIKYQKDIDAFVNVIKGALQPISVPPQDTFMATLGEVAWTHSREKPLVQSYHNPNQKANENLMSYMTRTVGGMATHWTCACPYPNDDEMKECPIDNTEFKRLLDEARILLNVNENEFDHSIRHRLVKKTLEEYFRADEEKQKKEGKVVEKRIVANLPLAVKRNVDNPEYVTWSAVDTVLGKWATEKDPRFHLATETRVTKLIRSKTDPNKVDRVLCRDLKTDKDYIVRAQQYVIACGAVGTPQILYHSNIRPDGLGEYLTEQSLSFCQIVLKRDLIENLEEHKKMMAEYQAEQAKLIGQLTQELAEYVEKLQDLEKQQSELEESKKNVQEREKELERRRSDLKRQREVLRRRQEEYRARQATLKDQQSKLEQVQSQLESESEDLEAEGGTFLRLLKLLENYLSKEDVERVKNTAGRLEATKEVIMDILARIKSQSAELADTKKQIEESEEAIRRDEEAIGGIEEGIERDRATIDNHEREIEEKKAGIERKMADVERKQEEANAKSKAIDSTLDAIEEHRKKHEEDPLPIPFNDPEPQVTLRYSSGKQYHVQIHRDAFAYGDVGPRADPRTVVDLRFFGRQDIDKKNRITFADPIEIQDQSNAVVRKQSGTTDGYGMPQATFHVTRSGKDAERDHEMMQDMCDAANALGAYLPGSSPQFMEPGLVLHITGTTRLGKSPVDDRGKESVANENSKLWIMDNVYVGGNNVIPDSTACNPTLTSVAYAIKASRDIISKVPKIRTPHCCIPNEVTGPFTHVKPTVSEATSTPALLIGSNFTEVNVKSGLSDSYWIADFPFRTKAHEDEGPVGPELLGSGLGFTRPDGTLAQSELRMYLNPYNNIQNQIVPPNEWAHTVVRTVDYAIASVYGNFRPKSGLNDIILCHSYGPSMDNLNMQGGTVSYLINPGDRTKGNWEMRDIGKSPAMHRLLTGRFSQKQYVEVMGFPIIAASGDRDSATPILLYTPTEWDKDGPYAGAPCAWATKDPLEGMEETSRLIHEVQVIHSTNGGLDKVLIAGREGVSLLWFEPAANKWRWANIGTGIPQSRKPFKNPYWGSGSVATARVGNDSIGYIASCEAFHGNVVSVYVKPPGTRRDQIVTSEHWRRFVIDDFGPLKPGEWTGTVHNVRCADVDGTGVDSIIVACMGYPEGKASNMGTYVYRPIDLQRGMFARYKISDASAGRIAVADYRCSGTWDVATISYSVPNYLETANPAMRILLNNVTQTRHTIKAQRIGDEVMIRVPRAKLAEHMSEMSFLDIAGKKLSIVVLPPHKEYVLGEAFWFMGYEYAPDGVKVINGELSWKDRNGQTVTRGIAVDARQAASMIPESNIVKAGSNGAIFVRMASSVETSMPGLKVEDMDDIATINTVPHNVDSVVRDMTFPWVACKDREWGQGGFDWPFYNLVGYHVLYDDDSLTNFCHIQAWTLGIGETAAFHNHDTKSFCEIHACISNGSGKGGMWWAKNDEGDDHFHHNTTEMDPNKLEQYADSVIVNDMEEHGPLWRTTSEGRPSLRPNDTVDYPYHAWLAGRREDSTLDQVFDVWLAFEFPSTEFQTGLSRWNGCAACTPTPACK